MILVAQGLVGLWIRGSRGGRARMSGVQWDRRG